MTSDRKPPHADTVPAQPALGARVRTELENLTPEQATRLRVMRSAAVKELDERNQRLHSRQWWVAGGLAGSAASVALLVGLLIPSRPLEQPFPDLNAEELAVVQSMDVLEELEFLAWMEEEANRAEAG